MARFQHERVEQVVVIGDIFEMEERIEETYRLLSEAGSVGVWGNHDYGLACEPSELLRAKYGEAVIGLDGHLLCRCDGEISLGVFLGAAEDLMRNIHGVAKVAKLDGDEMGYLLGKVAEIKRQT